MSAKLWIWTLGIFCIISISGCAAPLAALGASGTAAASSVGTTAATAAVANPVTAASVASTVTTGKSPLEHATSAATKKDCSFTNIVGPKPICQDIVLPTVTDNSTPLLGPADLAKEPAKR